MVKGRSKLLPFPADPTTGEEPRLRSGLDITANPFCVKNHLDSEKTHIRQLHTSRQIAPLGIRDTPSAIRRLLSWIGSGRNFKALVRHRSIPLTPQDFSRLHAPEQFCPSKHQSAAHIARSIHKDIHRLKHPLMGVVTGYAPDSLAPPAAALVFPPATPPLRLSPEALEEAAKSPR